MITVRQYFQLILTTMFAGVVLIPLLESDVPEHKLIPVYVAVVVFSWWISEWIVNFIASVYIRMKFGRSSE